MSLFHFCTSVEVRFADLDAFGHVNHAKYFTFMEQGRFQYFDALGLWNTSRPFHELGIIIAEAHCSYKKPVQLGDRVEVSVRVSRDYQSEKSIAVPVEWRKKIEEFERNT
ncbi:MAG: acyl-CoA thioesterase [Chloroflexi bacterium]|nr:acyl-CoA thioesterase [Chloroflexota bacterium]